MLRLRWFLIGIAVTTFLADYVDMKAHWFEMEAATTTSIATVTRVQATNNACLIQLAYNQSMLESWETKKKISTLAQVEVLQMTERAKVGEPEAVASLRNLGFSISKPTNHLVATVTYEHGQGMGGW